jgi:glycosyltransferase involved in cell wall biosynthesis
MAKVLIFCDDALQEAMAGPAIRCWEFAHSLAKAHTVTLLSSQPVSLRSDFFALESLQNISFKKALKQNDVLVTQTLPWWMAYYASKYRKNILFDSYDPLPIEKLELFKHYPADRQKQLGNDQLYSTSFSFLMADKVICASDIQRDLWIGFMCSLGLIGPEIYVQDPSFKNKMGIVPFGIKPHLPERNGMGLREQFKLKPSDFVLVWGGGIWNWFDPLTPIRAMHSLSQKRPDIKLVFLGTKHPNPAIPEMKMTQDAISLSKELHVYNKQVFFNIGWVPYEMRHNYLLDADAGISCHFDNLETRFSFRTRILDYLWAELPIITTEGDFFAGLVKNHHLGKAIPAQDPSALAQAIEELADCADLRKKCRNNIVRIKSAFTWDSVTLPLIEFINDLGSKKRENPNGFCTIASHLFRKVKNRGVLSTLSLVLNKILCKIIKRISVSKC